MKLKSGGRCLAHALLQKQWAIDGAGILGERESILRQHVGKGLWVVWEEGLL
jgi:hypothetical protein